MLFNSNLFLVFFAVTYLLYVIARSNTRLQNGILLVASYAFYSAWDWRFLSLIIASTIVDYVAARRIQDCESVKQRRFYLTCSIVFNLGMLGVFKYYDFGIESFAALASQFGFAPNLSTLRLILPVGISFYTFQTMSYTIDVYRGKCPAERRFFLMALYVAFFPQLVAGPIERARDLIPQLKNSRSITREDLAAGLSMTLLGYFKKVVLADSLAPLVNEVFDEPATYSGMIVFIATVGFAVQIYGDFSGYSLIARGISRLMGIKLMTNFRHPYFARSPRDFWHRWHISLSTWLQEYLYIGLGGSRVSRARTYGNLMTTMVLGGLWHGAAWNFVFWGLYHGSLLMVCHACKGLGERWQRGGLITHAASVFGTFLLTLFGWLLFRCSSNEQLTSVLHQLTTDFSWTPDAVHYAVPVLTAFTILQGFHLWQILAGTENVLLRLSIPQRVGAYVFLIASIAAVGFHPTPFIYFQF